MLETAERDHVDMDCGNAIAFLDKTLNTLRYFPHPAACCASWRIGPHPGSRSFQPAS